MTTSECDNCTCNNNIEPHTCPFTEEIYDDYESLCNCCNECTYQCAMDI